MQIVYMHTRSNALQSNAHIYASTIVTITYRNNDVNNNQQKYSRCCFCFYTLRQKMATNVFAYECAFDCIAVESIYVSTVRKY